MSGHSKWSNIKNKKGKADAKRGAVFTKIGREISVAVREGGSDPNANARLKDAINKAKAANMPNDNINRSIKRASGEASSDSYEEIWYEGYAASGVAVIAKALTDNRNRTAAEIRHIFDKNGGNLGTTGCVSFMFQEKGTIIVSKEDFSDEEKVMMDALELGALDVVEEDEVYEITTDPKDYYSIKDQMEDKGYNFLDTSIGLVPENWVEITDSEVAGKIEKLVEMLEDSEDIQEVFHNYENA